jgi:4-methylaminobutanoate oxidase (formaldehyde-forming)
MLERGGGDGPVDKSYVDDGAWSIEIGREFYPCTVSLRPLYDPTGIRPKA